MKTFKQELTELINKYNIENEVNMPDYIISSMICNMISAIGPSVKENLAWHSVENTE